MPAPTVFQPPPGNPRFPLFDSLRGIAALGVFVVHANLVANADGTWYGRYVVSLEAVLAIFFVISAFLLYRPFVHARVDRTRSAPRIPDYARNRFLRIVPAYWVALTVLAIYPGLVGFWTGHTWAYYLFLQEWDWTWSRGGIIPTWSLTVEIAFYIFLPFWALLMVRVLNAPTRALRLGIEFAGIVTLFALGIVARVIARGEVGDDPTSNVWAFMPFSIDWLSLGMLLAVVSVALGGRRPAPVRLIERVPGVCWLLSALLLLGAALLRPPGDFPVETGPLAWLAIHEAYGFAALALCVPAAIGGEHGGTVRAVLANRWLSWFGMISYGFFLWHHPILIAVGEMDPGQFWEDHKYLCVMVVAFPISVACGAASYYLIERPLLRRKRTRVTAHEPAVSLKRLAGQRQEPRSAEAIAEPAARPAGPPR